MTNTTSDRRVWRNLRRSRSAWFGAGIIGMFLIVALGAGVLAPFPPTEPLADADLSPSSEHWLGTDPVGRDVSSRVR